MPLDARGHPEHLQLVSRSLSADRSGGRQLPASQRAEAERAADTELPIALRVALALVDRVEIVPHAQQLREAAVLLELSHRSVELFRSRTDAAVCALVFLDHGDQQLVVMRIAHDPFATGARRPGCIPDFRGWSAQPLQPQVDGQRRACRPPGRR